MSFASPEASYIAAMALAFVLGEFALPDMWPWFRRHMLWVAAMPYALVIVVAPSPNRLVCLAFIWLGLALLRGLDAPSETAWRGVGSLSVLRRYSVGAGKALVVGTAAWLASLSGPLFPNPLLGSAGYLAQVLAGLAVYVFMISGGTTLVRWVLDGFGAALNEMEAAAALDPAGGDSLRMGRIIGNLERLIVTTLVTQGQFAAIGIVLAAKSIVRYERTSGSRAFADYYLIGTLTSIAVAIAGGLLLVALNPALPPG